jgi:hypothetical protein
MSVKKYILDEIANDKNFRVHEFHDLEPEEVAEIEKDREKLNDEIEKIIGNCKTDLVDGEDGFKVFIVTRIK